MPKLAEFVIDEELLIVVRNINGEANVLVDSRDEQENYHETIQFDYDPKARSTDIAVLASGLLEGSDFKVVPK
jgi:hypothetical protein